MNKKNRYFEKGLAVFLTFAACSLFLVALVNLGKIVTGLGQVAGILESIIIGIVIAYLLNPVMIFCEKKMIAALGKTTMKKEKIDKFARSVSIILALLFGVFIVAAVVGMMIPQLITSIYGIAVEMPDHMNNFSSWIIEMSKNYPAFEKYISEFVSDFIAKINEWFTYDFIVDLTKYIKYLTTGVISALNTVLNVVVGLIVAVYVLYSKEIFAGQAKKILYALTSPTKGNLILSTVRKTHEVFGGFIIGKIIDSAIIGVLCFICLSIMKMPYTLLISVIVGVTNVIPFFGPFIGAIPSTIILLLVSPIQALYFVIFIFILQQVDGNIIGPAILGESTGLSAFWVVFAIMLFGGLFGVVGMIIGVPTVAIVFYLIKLVLDHKLSKKKYPTETENYIHLKEIDVENNVLVQFGENEEIIPKKKPRFFGKKAKKSEE